MAVVLLAGATCPFRLASLENSEPIRYIVFEDRGELEPMGFSPVSQYQSPTPFLL